jgi:hypothetical protein
VRRWLAMLSGLILWAAHFLGVYLIASVADVVAEADAPAWRWGGVLFSLICMLGAVAIMGLATRAIHRQTEAQRAGLSGFLLSLTAVGGAVALVGILWQTLPNLIGY